MPIKNLSNTTLSIESLKSVAPPQYFSSVVLNENFYMNQPVSYDLIGTACRGFNAKVELVTSTAADRTLVYRALNGQDLSYVFNYSGIHYVAAYGVISFGAAIDADSLQWFV